jgi:catechol 2,3-dioxygenase-like lactoylglutathione lyase family enzyme
MTAQLKGLGAITLFAEDLEAVKAFYRDVFGLAVIFEDDDSAAFDFENTIVNVLRSGVARELIEPATVARPDGGSRLQLTIWVDDADAACVHVQERGVTMLNGPQDRDWGVRTAAFADPAGHVWEIAQRL